MGQEYFFAKNRLCYNGIMKASIFKKPLLYTTISLFGISALLGIIVVISSAYDMTVGRIISTTSVLGLLALFCMNNILRTESDRSYVKVLAIIALISNLVWSIPWLMAIWGVYIESNVIWKIVATAAIVSFNATMAANYLSFKKYNAAIWTFAISTIVISYIIAIMLIIPLYSNDYRFIGRYFEGVWRPLVVFCILLVFGTITTPILARVEANKDKTPKTGTDEAALRAQIETEVRAKIEAEMREKAATESAPVTEEKTEE